MIDTLLRATLLFSLAFAVSCQNAAPQPDPAAAKAAELPPGNLPFQFNPRPANRVVQDWCTGDFSETVPLFAFKDDYNRRYFLLGNGGAYQLIVDWGKLKAAVYLRLADQYVEIGTGNNYPACASKIENMSLKKGDGVFVYDNGQGINFQAEVRPAPQGGYQFEIILPPVNGTYGLTIKRCPTCR